MKIYDIEIQEPPYSDEQLDAEIMNSSFIVNVDSLDISAIKSVIDVLIEKGCKIVYIHSHPLERLTTIGVKV